jgi:hypothetical protein
MLFILTGLSQAVFHLSLYFSDEPGLFYLALLLSAWLLALKFVSGFLRSSFQRHLLAEKGLYTALLWGGILGMLFAISNLYAINFRPLMYWLAGLSYLLPMMILLLLRSRHNASRIP